MDKLLKKGIKVPKLLKMSLQNFTIEMEYINGVKLKDFINNPKRSEQELIKVIEDIGVLVLRVHQIGIIHGDLTTSNMLMTEEGEIYLIDFGLSYFKDSAEDRAVDLYVLERAFKSTHPQF